MGDGNAQPQEAQGGFCEDGAGHAKAGGHDHRPHDIGQNVMDGDAHAARPQVAGGGHKISGLERHGFRSGDAGHRGPRKQAEHHN